MSAGPPDGVLLRRKMGVTPAEALLDLLDKGGGGVCAVYLRLSRV